MRVQNLLFPKESRTFPGKRWINVFSRSFHLCFAAVYAGGLFFDVPSQQLMFWLLASGVSGGAMMAIDIYGNGKSMVQNRGFFILCKVVLLGIFFHTNTLGGWSILVITFLSGITSHAPARFRYYSLFHGKEI